MGLGCIILVITTLVAWGMSSNYNFYFWVINSSMLNNFGGANVQIITYTFGLLTGLLFVVCGATIKKKSPNNK